jgi:hypothetical protein
VEHLPVDAFALAGGGRDEVRLGDGIGAEAVQVFEDEGFFGVGSRSGGS